ncbi:MAG: hypothetical protein K9I74_11310 [Bacteroidales bacterium]|nr:hypothetical protein [Bacteroidales bacterium]
MAGLTVKYPNLSGSTQLQAARTERNNISSVLDTISLSELNASNSFSAIIEFEKNSPNYILFIEGTSYNDTISDITFEREGCNDEIVNFEYKFNGELRTDNELTIN